MSSCTWTDAASRRMHIMAMRTPIAGLWVASALLFLLRPAWGQEAEGKDLADAKTLTRINQAQWVLTAKVSGKQARLSELGPIYHELEFSEMKMLRGDPPAK